MQCIHVNPPLYEVLKIKTNKNGEVGVGGGGGGVSHYLLIINLSHYIIVTSSINCYLHLLSVVVTVRLVDS